MTREENIACIREACIGANAEIVELRFGCALQRPGSHTYMVIEDMTWGMNTKEVWVNSVPFGSMSLPIRVSKEEILKGIPDHNGEVWQVVGRPIRLADVLLAMCQTMPRYEVIVNRGNVFKPKKNIGAHLLWNLRKDDLTEQSDECIAFLAGLLG